VSNVSDGTEYSVKLPIEVFGPSVQELSGDITVTVEPFFTGIPEDARAKQGVNFRLDNNTITLKKNDNYSDTLVVTMLTKGINAPLEISPAFKLKATSVSGADNVVTSAKPIEVTLNYAVPQICRVSIT